MLRANTAGIHATELLVLESVEAFESVDRKELMCKDRDVAQDRPIQHAGGRIFGIAGLGRLHMVRLSSCIVTPLMGKVLDVRFHDDMVQI